MAELGPSDSTCANATVTHACVEVGSWALADGEGRALEIQSTEVKPRGELFISLLRLLTGALTSLPGSQAVVSPVTAPVSSLPLHPILSRCL